MSLSNEELDQLKGTTQGSWRAQVRTVAYERVLHVHTVLLAAAVAHELLLGTLGQQLGKV